MACIKQVCGYIPFLRLKGDDIKKDVKVPIPSQKAVASYDENQVTLAYECAKEIVDSMVNDGIGSDGNIALLFASSSFSDSEKNPAVFISEALDLPESTITLNITGGNNAFVDAVYVASTLVDSGKVKYAIVVSGEKRRSDDWKLDFGFSDSGGAVLVAPDTEKEFIFKIKEFYFISEETFDTYRKNGKVLTTDERFVAQEEYLAILKKLSGINVKRFYVSVPTYGISQVILKQLKIKDDVFQSFGNLGNSYIPILLAYSTGFLDPMEDIVIISFGTGLKGLRLVFSGGKSSYDKILAKFERKRLISFADYIRIKDVEGFPEDESSVPMLWREKKQNIRFYGQKCSDCGGVIFPMQNYCIVCGSKNLKLEKLPKRGEIFTFTEDYLTVYSEIFPPVPMLVVQLENGARVYVQGTDVDPKDRFKIGDKVELTLRILNSYGGMLNYFYKARKAG
ncbi:MAG: zinc ribbon domain-containing protein [Candidatus Calescibacterium sp.]|nr:zinc ribbon domain-containing protein [Candidatus Calescibacterium sp.]MCX7734954.1 zinc ribbon domain-containing protein [bacterium]